MNVEFFVNGRRYKTPCPTVLQSEEFSVKFFTDKHFVLAHMVNKIVPSRISKMYFEKIDDMSLSSIKCDFHFNNRYNHPKEFLSNLWETLNSFLNSSLAVEKNLLAENRPVYKSVDEVLERIVEIVRATNPETTEAETATETATETVPETATDPEVGNFVYDVHIHNDYGWDTYTVRADGLESAEYKAVRRMELETDEEEYSSIDVIRIYKENSEELLKEIIFEPAETEPETKSETTDKETKELSEPEDIHIDGIKKFKEKADLNSLYGEATEPITVHQFERLTKTLYKSLFKAIGLEETKKIPFIISNNMVFFNYNDTQYKYYPSQCKIFKKCGRKYQRINWKDFVDDNSPTDQKQAIGRSPPHLLLI